MPDFEEYKKMQSEIENNIMARLHPTLEQLLNGQNRLEKKVDKLEPILAAWNNGKKLGLLGEWIAEKGYKIFLFLGSIGLGWLAIRDSGIYAYFKHLFWR